MVFKIFCYISRNSNLYCGDDVRRYSVDP